MTITPIKTERDYQKALREIEKLWDAKPNTAKGDRLECWSRWSRPMSRNTTGSTLQIRSKPQVPLVVRFAMKLANQTI